MTAIEPQPSEPRALDVVFVGNEGSRTGAPLMLLYFLRWLRAHTDLVFELVLLQDGPLAEDYRAVAPVTILPEVGDEGLPARIHETPVVYCNCVRSVLFAGLLDEGIERTVITHVHELEGGIQLSLPYGDVDRLVPLTDRYVAASELVRQNLVVNHGIAREDVALHYEFIDVAAFDASAGGTDESAALRAQLGIPAAARVVGAMGTTEWRKGPDLFVALAVLLDRGIDPPVHLVWVGADPARPETEWLRGEIARAGLGDRVHLVGVDPHPARWLRMFDVFVLTSREDPFPLVCLESSLLGVPIVCFDNTGMAEFTGDGECGYMVEYLNVEAMADRVRALLGDRATRDEVGSRAAGRVRERFDVEVGAPALHRDLEGWRARG